MIINLLGGAVFNLLDGFVFWELLKRLNIKRYQTRWIQLLFIVLYALNTQFLGAVIDPFIPWWSTRVLMFTMDYMLLLIFFEKKLMSMACVAAFAMLNLISEEICMLLIGLLPVIDTLDVLIGDPFLALSLGTASRILEITLVMVIPSFMGKDMVLKKVSRYQFIFFFLLVVIIINSTSLYFMIIRELEITKQFMIYQLLMMVLFTGISAWVFKMIIKSGKAEERHALEKQQRELEKEFDFMTQTYLTSLRHYRHDYRNSLTSIQALLEEKKYDAAVDYFQEMKEDFQAHDIEFIDNMPAVSALMIRKHNRAREQGIDLRYHLPKTVEGEFSEVDINRIVYNVVDNAIEAASKEAVTDKWIDLTMYEKNRNLFLMCENPFDWISECENGVYRTTKKKENQEHGVGLSSIRELADKYDGDVWIETGNKTFKICVMLSHYDENASVS